MGGGRGLCLGPTGLEKAISEGAGPHLGAQQASWARVGRANALCSSPARLWLIPDGSFCLPLLFSPASLLCPQGPTWPGGVLEDKGSAWELSRLPGPKWVGQLPSAPLPLLPEDPSCLPLLISLTSLLCPKGPTRPGGGFGGQGTHLGAQQAPGSEWAR